MLNLCYLNMIRCDDCVTSHKDAVHESLIEVLGCSTRLGGIHPPVSESVVHGESYLITGGTFAVVGQVDHCHGLVDNTSRVEDDLPLGVDTVLSAMVLTIALRCITPWQ